MRLRNVPLLLEHYKNSNEVPKLMALGFSAHILFMKCAEEDGKYLGTHNGAKYPVQDDNAAIYAASWKQTNGIDVVNQILGNEDLWETNLKSLPGFAEAVAFQLKTLEQGEVLNVVKEVSAEKELA